MDGEACRGSGRLLTVDRFCCTADALASGFAGEGPDARAIVAVDATRSARTKGELLSFPGAAREGAGSATEAPLRYSALLIALIMSETLPTYRAGFAGGDVGTNRSTAFWAAARGSCGVNITWGRSFPMGMAVGSR